jgi:hypothetical protein
MAWAGFAILQKADPYHDASGKFTSAGGEGSALASDAVKVLHHGQQYTAHFDKAGNISKVVGHYALSKKDPSKLTDYVMHDAATGKVPTATMKQVIGAAHDQRIAIKAKEFAAAQEAAKKAQKTVIPVQYSGSHYTVHLNSDGTLNKAYLTNSGKKVFDQDEGQIPTAHHQYLAHAASKVSPTLHTTVPGKVLMPKAPESVATPKEKEFTFAGKQFKNVSVTHEGKPYSVTFNDKGEADAIESHSLNGKPAPAFMTWQKHKGEPHSGQKQIIDKAAKEGGIAAPNKASMSAVAKPAGSSTQVEGVYKDAEGNVGAVVLKKSPVPPETEALFATASSKQSALVEFGNGQQKLRSAAARDAVRDYQDSSFALNKKLRDNQADLMNPDHYLSKMLAGMDEAMETAVVPVSMTLVRGIPTDIKTVTGFSHGEELVGKVFTDKGFGSFSAHSSVASKFGNHVTIKVSIPKGSQGIVMPKFDWEKEVVLPRNGTFRIKEVQKAQNGYGSVLICDYLGTKQ